MSLSAVHPRPTLSRARQLLTLRLSLAFSLLAPLHAATTSLTGRVTGATGAPLPDAIVYVHSAAPKTGTSPLCPTCHPECEKPARTDAAGVFRLDPLSPTLVLRLLVVAPGHVPKFVPDTSASATPVAVTLEPHPRLTSPPALTARGRVLDSAGLPIAGAVLEINGAAYDDGRTQYGGLKEIDLFAVTDRNGDFLLTAGASLAAFVGRLSARGYANQAVHLAAGKSHPLTVTRGATLTGRLVREGRPVPHVSVGLSPQDRASGGFVGDFAVGTDADGRFTFTHLPPRRDYLVYGKMDTTGAHGSTDARPLHLGRDDSTTDIGYLPVEAAHRLAGRVALPDGASLPDGSRLLVGRDRVNDHVIVNLSPDGAFDVTGIPPGIVTLSPRVPGFRTSPQNKSYEDANRRLIGRVERDITGLVVLLEPRDPNEGRIYASSIKRPAPGEHPREHPLRGTESPTP